MQEYKYEVHAELLAL